MPAIKLKKATQNYLAEKEREKQKEEEDKAAAAASQASKTPEKSQKTETPSKSVKSKAKFYEAEVLHEKRKRTIPPTEQRLITWIEENLESKEGFTLSLVHLYEYYTETCLLESINVVDVPVFNRYIKEKVGKEFGLKENSAYQGLIKQKKVVQKNKKIVAETLTLKVKDILQEVITDKGNPNRGLRFHALQRLVGQKYPALQVDVFPNRLMSSIDRGVRYGWLQLVKGTGKCGFYRLFGESTAEEDIKAEQEKERIQKEKKEKREKEKEAKKSDDPAVEDDGEKDGEKGEEKEDKKASKKRKRKGKEDKDEAAEDKDEAAEDKDEPAKKKKKKSKKGKKKFGKDNGAWGPQHSEPKSVQDIFPLAITYQSDPKETSVAKIKKYISDYHPSVNLDRITKVLEKGIDKELWQQLRGSGMNSGTFRLLAEDYDPANNENIEDMICQAIVACHEPKQASVRMIKRYIMEYHPDFNIEARPQIFKKALERAVNKNKLRQVSGIGASGTFQLIGSFVPSPAILAGDAEGELQEKEAAVAADDYGDDDFGLAKYKETYIVRKTKSGRMGGIPITVLSKERKQKRR